MNLPQFVDEIDKAYSEPGIIKALSEDANYDTGDGLANFIYYEAMDLLGAPVDPDTELTLDQLLEVHRGLSRATQELEDVTVRIRELMVSGFGTKSIVDKSGKC